jgi:hypothetical protein
MGQNGPFSRFSQKPEISGFFIIFWASWCKVVKEGLTKIAPGGYLPTEKSRFGQILKIGLNLDFEKSRDFLKSGLFPGHLLRAKAKNPVFGLLLNKNGLEILKNGEILDF